MSAHRTYTAAEVRQMGVPAYHSKGFWYDPVAPRSRELAFFFGHRDPKKRWRWHQAPPELPEKGWRHYSDLLKFARGSHTFSFLTPGTASEFTKQVRKQYVEDFVTPGTCEGGSRGQ
jgi:hypothetical protein